MTGQQSCERGGFGSRVGFVLAAAGSAIGLGNVWRFPYTAGQHGGAAFVLIYLVCVAAICVPVLFAELAIGRATRRNPVGAFKALAPGSRWFVVGGLGVLTGFAILAFYSVVAGWTLGYLGKALLGAFAEPLTHEQSVAMFEQIEGAGIVPVLLTGAFLLLTALVVRGGVEAGIERAAKILMPIFFLLLVAMAIRAMTLEGAGEGISFFLRPDLSKIDGGVFMGALGQAFFSLSLGMGAMITYGSYLGANERMPGAAVSVAVADTTIAVLAGLIIFPTLFAAGGDPSAGPGLVFVTLPTVFGKLPAGFLFAIAFYSLLVIAALTSTVSLLEVVVCYFVDERGWKRERATWLVTLGCFLLAIPSALSGTFLDWQSIIFGNYALTIGAMLICVFVGWVWGVPAAVEEIGRGGAVFPLAAAWGVIVRWVAPVAIAAVLIYIVATGNYM
ncbi:MAG: sodium-dependent transporter [Acidobacteriota bacterium]